MSINFSISIPERDSFDIIVCGGGIAGCAAALQSARLGKKTLLIEKSAALGGLATIGLVNFIVPMCNGRGKRICRGMAEEFLRMSIKYGYDTIPAEWKNGEPEGPVNPRYCTSYDPYMFALQLTDLLDDSGVTLFFDCSAAYPITENGHVAGVVTDSKSGFEFYAAKQIIDTTGDAEIASKAGIPTVDGKNYFSYFGRQITLDSCRRAVETGHINDAILNNNGGHSSLYGQGHPDGKPFYFGTGVDVESRYFIENQKLLLENVKKAGRFERELTAIPMVNQFREIRRIEGDTVLHETDAFRHFDDSVCAVNDFDRRDFLFEVPLSALVRHGYDNLITAGRGASADGWAWDVIRVIPPAILTGQASAFVASQAIDNAVPVYDTDIKKIQNSLEGVDVMVHFDDSLVPEMPDTAHMHVEKL